MFKKKTKQRYYKVTLYRYDITDVFYCSDIMKKFNSLCLYKILDSNGELKNNKESSYFIRQNIVEEFTIETLYK